MKTLPQAAISKVVIERPAKLCRISIYAARPGVIIGKKGADIEKLRKTARHDDLVRTCQLNIVEIRKPEIDAKLVAQGVADQLERRIAFRRAMKRAVQSALRLGAEGIRITCAGRLGGAEIARTEWYREGRVPLHTLRAQRRLCRGRGAHRLWRVRRQGLDLQGRDPRPRPARAGPADDGGSDLRRPSGARRARQPVRKEQSMLQPKAHQVPQGLQGPHPWRRQGRHRAQLRRLRPQGDGAGADHRAPDRGGPPRDHASHQAPGAFVDPHLPGRSGLVEAGRSPHGLGQGLAGILGRPRQAGPHPVRAGRRSRPASPRSRSSARPRSCRSRPRSSPASARPGRGGRVRWPQIDDLKAEDRRPAVEQLGELKREQFNLRFQAATNQLEKPSRVREVRRTIARSRRCRASARAPPPSKELAHAEARPDRHGRVRQGRQDGGGAASSGG